MNENKVINLEQAKDPSVEAIKRSSKIDKSIDELKVAFQSGSEDRQQEVMFAIKEDMDFIEDVIAKSKNPRIIESLTDSLTEHRKRLREVAKIRDQKEDNNYDKAA